MDEVVTRFFENLDGFVGCIASVWSAKIPSEPRIVV